MYRSVSYTALLTYLEGVLTLALTAAPVWRAHGPASVATATMPSSHASVEKMHRAVEGVCFMWLLSRVATASTESAPSQEPRSSISLSFFRRAPQLQPERFASAAIPVTSVTFATMSPKPRIFPE